MRALLAALALGAAVLSAPVAMAYAPVNLSPGETYTVHLARGLDAGLNRDRDLIEIRNHDHKLVDSIEVSCSGSRLTSRQSGRDFTVICRP